jgi:hypothetical protein
VLCPNAVNSKNFVLIGLLGAILAVGGWFLYNHVPKPPPAPKDLTKILPQQLLQKANSAQLAVLRGTASVALKTAATAPARGKDTTGLPVTADSATVPGLTLTLAGDGSPSLKVDAANATDALVTWSLPAGTLFSNGTGQVVLLRDVYGNVPAKSHAQSTLPVAATSTSKGQLTGTFTRRNGSIPALDPLLKIIAGSESVSPGAMQTAVLAICENVPLDSISSVPTNLQPPSLDNNDPLPFRESTPDIMSAFVLLQEAGLDTRKLAMAGDPEFKLLAMLNPDSHRAAKSFFGIGDGQEWSYWRNQLLAGDPALRHYALYGIARYYPEVALQMLPHWIRTVSLSHSYRVSAAWALALIDDRRARMELTGLRQELAGDPAMRQALDRALRHWSAQGSSAEASAG